MRDPPTWVKHPLEFRTHDGTHIAFGVANRSLTHTVAAPVQYSDETRSANVEFRLRTFERMAQLAEVQSHWILRKF